MLKTKRSLVSRAAALALLGPISALVLAGTAQAFPGYGSNVRNACFPEAVTVNVDSCTTCHKSSSGDNNAGDPNFDAYKAAERSSTLDGWAYFCPSLASSGGGNTGGGIDMGGGGNTGGGIDMDGGGNMGGSTDMGGDDDDTGHGHGGMSSGDREHRDRGHKSSRKSEDSRRHGDDKKKDKNKKKNKKNKKKKNHD